MNMTKQELFYTMVSFAFVMVCGYLLGFMEGEASGMRLGACIGMAAEKERRVKDITPDRSDV